MKSFAKVIVSSSLILPVSVWAAPAGMGEAIIWGILFGAFIFFILIPYLLARVVLWIYGIVKFTSKRKIDVWHVLLIIIDIPMIYIAWEICNTWMLEKQQLEKLELSETVLTAPQVLGGIAMPEGTEIQTDFDRYRTQPEPEKFIYAKFKQPVVWNGIEIIDISRRLHWYNETIIFWMNVSIDTKPDKAVPVGEWWCRAGVNMEWQLMPQADGKIPKIPYTQSVEPYVYLHYCSLEKGQTALLPEFGAELSVEAIRRKDKYQDVTKGLWRTYLIQNKESWAASKIHFDKFRLLVDSNRIVHEFVVKLDNDPAQNCGMPEHTLLAWKKSRPNVIQVASNESNKIPKKCWGKTLVRVASGSIQMYD